MTANARQVGGDHYKSKAIQPWDAMAEWMSPEEFAGFLRGNAIKYLARCKDKDGIKDVEKAQHYIEKLLEVLKS
jgi:predicted O-linked N-acetylglucosamine transferase (SPINDLY family)